MNISEDIVSREFQSEDFDVLLDDLVSEIKTRNYRVTRIYDIDNIHDRLEEGIDVTVGFRRYKIVEFCNLNVCSELISNDLLAGVFMPVRCIVYQRKDETGVYIAFLKPTAFARLFNSKPLMQVATKLHEDMANVLEEVA